MSHAQTLSATGRFESATILTFWFEQPAHDASQLLAKFGRWYQGGAELDNEIQARFLGAVERALAGQLSAWESDSQGKLALILLLDQFTRNLFRETPRAYAGDATACRLALELLAERDYPALALEQRLFCIMPLIHSESLLLHDRALKLAQDFVGDAPAELRAPWRIGAERSAHYRGIIQRFGRFPHRNEILNRVSTSEELAFLVQEAVRPSPLQAAAAASPAP